MKTKIFTSIILFSIAIYSYGQIEFKKGYFVSNDNNRVECLIKNSDWLNNPKEIVFKREDTSVFERVNISEIKEFGINGFSKYIRANVQIDRSSNNADQLTKLRNPIWSHEEILLKVILEGKASLYYYEEGSLKRFFYSISDTSITQLVYKQYLTDNASIGSNYRFRQQLWNDLKCANSKPGSLGNVNYNLSDIEKYFSNYNVCSGGSVVKYNNKIKRDVFNLKIFAGLNMSSMSTSYSVNNYGFLDVKNNIGFTFGVESEYIMPVNMNKWGLVIEPTFQYFYSKKYLKYDVATVNYSSFEFPVGIRYYMFLKPELKAFLNGFYNSGYSYNFNSIINFDDGYNSTTLKIKPRSNFAFGGGVEYNRVSAEIRYYTNRELLNNYAYWSSNYYRLSLIFGYKLIKARHNKGSNLTGG